MYITELLAGWVLVRQMLRCPGDDDDDDDADADEIKENRNERQDGVGRAKGRSMYCFRAQGRLERTRVGNVSVDGASWRAAGSLLFLPKRCAP